MENIKGVDWTTEEIPAQNSTVGMTTAAAEAGIGRAIVGGALGRKGRRDSNVVDGGDPKLSVCDSNVAYL